MVKMIGSPFPPPHRRVAVGALALLMVAAGCGSDRPARRAAASSKSLPLATSTTAAPPTAAPQPTAVSRPTTTPIPDTTATVTTVGPSTTLTLPTTTTVPAPPTTATTTPEPPTVSGATPTTTILSSPSLTVPPGSVLEVGDSVSVDAAPYLQAAGVTVNGAVSRQFSAGIEVVQEFAAAHQLPPTLVVDLGTNGTVTAGEIDEMVQAATGVRHIVFVTIDVPRSWEVGDNAVLMAAPARYPGLVTVANWYAVASQHPEWFTEDEVHLQTTGAQALAVFIIAAAQ